ncbi:MAG: precorrin-3B C(17)-methyltransferase [Candidatus Omnitrophica bacterium]|nr:precorrin-3B C(17)-methyltransferase [Candidatus Omnitrophota bacterium]
MRTLRLACRKESIISIEQGYSKRSGNSPRQGRLSIIGIGPGALDQLSRKAYDSIRESECIVGYRPYIKLLGPLVSGKHVISSGMTQEIKRVKLAIEMARKKKKVCLISSGDPGIYGMAGISLELMGNKDRGLFSVEIIPGITAATGCAGRLGAPLSHDFAVISLSDLLTDSGKIEERLKSAAKADFVIVLYNPKSKKRTKLLDRAWDIIMKYRPAATPVGIVKNAYRNEERIAITCLKEARNYKDIDMSTTIIIGNLQTYVKNGYMITPRGYKLIGLHKTKDLEEGF